MKTVKVEASTKNYEVHIGPGLLEKTGEYIRTLAPEARRLALVSDGNVAPLYGERLLACLEAAGYETALYVLPPGEESKNGVNYLSILSFLAESGISRSDLLLALGGGMVGDIAAFAAATYLRGIGYVQLPTSLLAMVDSSVGGKTAIDLPGGKNLAGAFCQPELVLADTLTLNSLPREMLRDGCAEVLKYGLLGDEQLLEQLEEKALDFDREEVIFRCVSMKRDYVCADEFDTGLRRKLNLGHTLGHAVEKHSRFSLSHGQSVAVGLACVSRAAAAAGRCSPCVPERVTAVLERLGLPTASPADVESLMPAMLSDKKRRGSLVHVIVPEAIGCCRIVPMDAPALERFMKAGM